MALAERAELMAAIHLSRSAGVDATNTTGGVVVVVVVELEPDGVGSRTACTLEMDLPLLARSRSVNLIRPPLAPEPGVVFVLSASCCMSPGLLFFLARLAMLPLLSIVGSGPGLACVGGPAAESWKPSECPASLDTRRRPSESSDKTLSAAPAPAVDDDRAELALEVDAARLMVSSSSACGRLERIRSVPCRVTWYVPGSRPECDCASASAPLWPTTADEAGKPLIHSTAV